MNLGIIHQTHVTQKVEVYECDSESFSEGEYEKGEYEVQAFMVRGQRNDRKRRKCGQLGGKVKQMRLRRSPPPQYDR